MINSSPAGEILVQALCVFFLIVSVVFVIEVIISLRSDRVLRKVAASNRNVDDSTSEYHAIKNVIASNYGIINENIYGVYDRLKDIKGRTIEINNCIDYLAKENAELRGIVEDLKIQLPENTRREKTSEEQLMHPSI